MICNMYLADYSVLCFLEILNTISHRSRRQQKVKLFGRRINHLWKESNNKTDWYAGIVLSVIHGMDGDEGAVHEVKYDDDDVYELSNLSDLLKVQLKFIDI